MNQKVLVTYATKYGATAGIAEFVCDKLREAGLTVELRPLQRIADLSAYTAVVLGSAVYIGRWRKEAVSFLHDNKKALMDKKVWLFSSGPTGEGEAAELVEGWTLPGPVQKIADEIQPRDVAVFHGALDASKLNVLEKWVINNIKVPVGDFRSWDAVSDWANAIAADLHEAEAVSFQQARSGEDRREVFEVPEGTTDK